MVAPERWLKSWQEATPLTAVFSRIDRVVAWPASIDRASLTVEHVEVRASHGSLGLDPDVWAVVAHALAEVR